MSKIKAETWENLDGTENYKCRAWVNFNGTATPPVIRASGNVSSVVKNGTGNFTITFNTALPDANFSVTGTGKLDNQDLPSARQVTPRNFQTTSVTVLTVTTAPASADAEFVNIAIFR